MDTVRVFIRWLGTVDGVDSDLHLKVRSPDITPEQNTRTVMLEKEAAEEMLEYLGRYRYASRHHVVLSLLWHTMLRIGSALAIDLKDYSLEEQYREIKHRPETDTPLKNKHSGERLVAFSGKMCLLLDDWIREQRPDFTDEHGREPLLASKRGRLAATTIRNYSYQFTRPCAYGAECPHDRDPDDCDATERTNAATCPSTVSPHAIRRGAITNHLNEDVPETVFGDRANVSQDVLEQHYDQRSEREKMEQRRGCLDGV